MKASIGVAFDGLTVPGRDEPLFTVEKGTMVLGLGIAALPDVAVEWHGADGRQTLARLPAEGSPP